MGTSTVGATVGTVVLIPFPFSDLSQAKLRPALVIANASKGDWVLCQITSKSYADARAIRITDEDFAIGSLRLISYVRPGKLFTANQDLIVQSIGTVEAETLTQVVEAIVSLVQDGF